MVANDIQGDTIVSNPEESIFTSKQETPQISAKRKMQLEELNIQTTKGKKQVNLDISFILFILSYD